MSIETAYYERQRQTPQTSRARHRKKISSWLLRLDNDDENTRGSDDTFADGDSVVAQLTRELLHTHTLVFLVLAEVML